MSDLDSFLAAIRTQESGGNYNAYNPGSGAGGAYQFLDSTWRGALNLAGLGDWGYTYPSASGAPAWLQDAAAGALMQNYYNAFGSWYSVAEAWYGGPGAVGHPEWGGGPGYPTVGQYADQVMALYYQYGGSGGSGGGGGSIPDPTSRQEWQNVLNDWSYTQWLFGYADNANNSRTYWAGQW